jgi:2-succinyl-5-enolpyruvyl-6-hydroxy-3-cyclohexene-1-carboxylate synthase
MSEPADTDGIAAIGLRWCWTLIDNLAAAGVAHAVISPGSRSTPLTLAALRHPGLRTHVNVDERSAGFFALGLAKATGQPVMLIATSGSAIANWFPAATEANQGRVPLILLSADRPPELHDCGANQTMPQAGLFGVHVRACHALPPPEADARWLASLATRAVAASLGPLPGPVHLNVPLREPLVPSVMPELRPSPAAPLRLASAPALAAGDLDALAAKLHGRGAVVCGPEALAPEVQIAVLALAQRLGVPIFADLLSNLRHEAVVAHPDKLLRELPRADWVLRLGGAPVGKAANAWLARNGGTQIVVAAHPRVADPVGTATHVVQAEPAALCAALAAHAAHAAPTPASADWLATVRALDAAAGACAAQCCAAASFEGSILRSLLHGLPANTPVFLGNSLTVRAADWFVGHLPVPLRCFGNRGVSGIDGNLSTAAGIAAALGPTIAIVGDLAFLHDLNALAASRALPLTVVLLDNGGGGIFDHLPQATLPEFERGWLTPQDYDPAAAAQAFGIGCDRAADGAAVLAAVRRNMGNTVGSTVGLRLIHVPIDRAASLAQIRAFQSAPLQGA